MPNQGLEHCCPGTSLPKGCMHRLVGDFPSTILPAQVAQPGWQPQAQADGSLKPGLTTGHCLDWWSCPSEAQGPLD